MKIGYLKKDSRERVTLKKGWRVNAWRVVDAQGVDMFQPWCSSKSEAIEVAKSLGIRVAKIAVHVLGRRTHIKLLPETLMRDESAVYYELKKELQHQGYDCIKTSPQRDGHMTSAPFYVRARDNSWAILDGNHALRCPAEVLNKVGSIEFENFWGTPAPKGNDDQLSGSLPTPVGQQQDGTDSGLDVG